MPSATLGPPLAQVPPLRLGDPNRYRVQRRVPVLYAGPDFAEADLHRLADGSQARAGRDQPALVLLGKTTRDGAEQDQPPLVGVAAGFQVARHQGKPCLVCDLYLFREHAREALSYPRRDVETDPTESFVDAVVLLRQGREDAGIVVKYHRGGPGSHRTSPKAAEDLSPGRLRRRLGRQHAKQQADLARLRADVERLRYRRDREERREVLAGLKAEGFDLDVAEELGDASRMDEAGFNRHVRRIRLRYRRAVEVGGQAV